MKFISLFAGVGGFDLALTRLGHECVYANDFDKYCKITYEKNFTHKLDCRSITEVRAEEIPDHELLVGGFPCQSFSIAGKRGGFEDTRGTMFFEIARILQAKKPRLFILENVKGLLSHDNGQTFKTIVTTLTELGYDLQWQVLNSKNFGVPQNRERVFIVGHLRGTSRPKVFPIIGDNEENSKEFAANCITANYWKGIDNHGQRTHIGTLRTHKDGAGFREMKSGVSPTIPARAREDGSGQPVVIEAMQIRRLTPIECERLQGFPEVEKSAIIEVCLEPLKNRVNVESQNHKLPKPVGNVEKKESTENVQYAVSSFNIKHPQTNSPVQPDVLISCGERTVEIHSQEKLLLSVNTAKNQNSSALPMSVEIFVQMIAGISTMSEKIISNGKEELQVKEQNLTDQGNGKNSVMISGNGIMQPAKDAKNDLTIPKELLKSITSNPFAIKPTDTNMKTLFSYVLNAISGL